MARQEASIKKTRTRYSQDYKTEALALAGHVGISAAARELGLQPSQLYQWRAKRPNRSKAPQIASRLWPTRMPGSSANWPRSQKSLKSQKNRGVLCQEPEVKYAFIHRHRQASSIQCMCMVLGVAHSG
ncbi:Transposase [Halomonas cupida]|uniref:Transposase n=1 Tax=Halomonas cupida TaxID=44933 RepID=A0A1M7LVC7_9GAMM|nr:Transposase [Halomonas cupida]